MVIGNSGHRSGQSWQSTMLGLSAIALAILGCMFHFTAAESQGGSRFLAGQFWKVAIVLALAWVAWPQLEKIGWQRFRGAMLTGIILVLVLYAIRPRIGAYAAMVLVAISAATALLGWFRKLTR